MLLKPEHWEEWLAPHGWLFSLRATCKPTPGVKVSASRGLCQCLVQTLVVYATDSFAAAAACTTLCDPIDGSPPGSPVPGILQARILEWVAISFSNALK